MLSKISFLVTVSLCAAILLTGCSSNNAPAGAVGTLDDYDTGKVYGYVYENGIPLTAYLELYKRGPESDIWVLVDTTYSNVESDDGYYEMAPLTGIGVEYKVTCSTPEVIAYETFFYGGLGDVNINFEF